MNNNQQPEWLVTILDILVPRAGESNGMTTELHDEAVETAARAINEQFENANDTSDFIKGSVNGETLSGAYAQGCVRQSIAAKRRWYANPQPGKEE